MKRFSFFLAVFSVGLVLFLVVTGQFGRLFRGTDSSEPVPSWVRESQLASEGNKVVYLKKDWGKRVVFRLEGYLDEVTGLGVQFGEQVSAPTTLTRARIVIPMEESVAGSASALTTLTELTLEAGKVVYDNNPDRAAALVLSEGLVCTADDGSRFETRSISIEYDKNLEEANLHGEDPVEVRFPAITIYGRRGLEGVVDSTNGLRELSIRPPLVVVLDQARGGTLLGLEGDLPESAASGPAAPTQIYLLSDGPLVIDRTQHRATFTQHVTVFRAPPQVASDPPAPREPRFDCTELELRFDPTTLRFVGAQARRGTEPVRVTLEDGSRLHGDRLDWLEGQREAVLDGNVHYASRLGEFEARQARYTPALRQCRLEAVHAQLRGRELSSSNSSGAPAATERMLGDWSMAADEAEFVVGERRGSGTEGRTRLRNFQARSRSPGTLIIREVREPGARLTGETLTYDGATDRLVLTGSGDRRPLFVDGGNRTAADTVELRLAERELIFEGTVDCHLQDVPVEDASALPAWLSERGPDDHARVQAARLRLAWNELQQFSLVEALAHGRTDAPERSPPTWVRLDWIGRDPFTLEGERATWTALDSRILLTGKPARVRYRGDLVELNGELVRFELGARSLYAEDSSHVTLLVRDLELLRHHLEGAPSSPRARAHEMAAPVPAAASELGELRSVVKVVGPKVQVDLPLPISAANGNAPGETVGTNGGRGPPALPLQAVRGWNDRGGEIVLQQHRIDRTTGQQRETLAVAGQDLSWDATSQRLVLQGEGRQRLERFGILGRDTLSARKVTLHTDTQRALLDGEVAARFHQRPPGSRGAGPNQPSTLPWDVKAGHVVLDFRRVEEAGETRFEVDTLAARGRISVTSTENGVAFDGAACDWSAELQMLRVFDPDDRTSVQTFRHAAGDRASDVRAREIRVTRDPTPDGRGTERLWIYLMDEVVANFQRSADGGGTSRAPNTFRLLSQNLLVEVAPESTSSSATPLGERQIRSVHAWEDVSFHAGATKVFASRGVYQASEQEASFFGRPGEKVQVVQTGMNPQTYDRVTLKQMPDGSTVIRGEGGSPWSGSDVKRILDLLESEDRAAAP